MDMDRNVRSRADASEAIALRAASLPGDRISSEGQRRVQLALINPRNLERECFVRSMEVAHPDIFILGYGSVGAWSADCQKRPVDVVLFNIGSHSAADREVGEEIARLVAEAAPISVVVLAEEESLQAMIAAVDRGARGYIPASIGVNVVIEATRLAAAGGVFLPVASILSMREAVSPKAETASGIADYLPARQAKVADALRRGKANKIIAYELNMCESTVKVHVRNIMKKLKVSNRTEAAFRLNAMFPPDE